MDGISVIICCYNSSDKIGKTLQHLASQEGTEGIAWEILLVDNASTDNTAEVARKIWTDSLVPLRIVLEPLPGLSKAREAGINHANYGFLSFIDDDNWVCSCWISKVFEIMTQKPEVAICGGMGVPVFETAPPLWFLKYQQAYAVGTQGDIEGYIKSERGYLYGAGSTLRKSAWEDLKAHGFRYLLSGRKGKALSSGEDYELCMALSLSGYKLWYCPELTFKHFMPAGRLTWPYLINLFRAFGRSDVITTLYLDCLIPKRGLKFIINKSLILSICYSIWLLIKALPGYLVALSRKGEGHFIELYFNRILSNLIEKMRNPRKFVTLRKSIRKAPWIKLKTNLIK
jgi:glycosyltransferase involved in cell wall biosynthesis